jgi:hypothetical protein
VSERARAWLAVAAVAGVAVAALVFLRTSPAPSARPSPGPLASPVVTPGAVGGLLPDVPLRGRFGVTQARQLRPAVVMLVRTGCDCVAAIRQVVAETAPLRIATYVVEAGTSFSFATSLAAQSGGEAGGFADPEGALAAAYRLRTDAALVLVRGDGVVHSVVAAIAPSLRLDPALRALV